MFRILCFNYYKTMTHLIHKIWILVLFGIPLVSSAKTIKDIIVMDLNPLLAALAPVLIGIAVVFFIWGVANYILKSDDAAGRESARQIMIWGIIALFVIITVWGLVAVLTSTFLAGGSKPVVDIYKDLIPIK